MLIYQIICHSIHFIIIIIIVIFAIRFWKVFLFVKIY